MSLVHATAAACHRRTEARSTWLVATRSNAHDLPARHRRSDDGSAAVVARALGITGLWLGVLSLVAVAQGWSVASPAALVGSVLVGLAIVASRWSTELHDVTPAPLLIQPRGVNHQRIGYDPST